jgi:hypothetical protein
VKSDGTIESLGNHDRTQHSRTAKINTVPSEATMSPIRQQLIDAIAQTPDTALAETLQRLQTPSAPVLPTSTSTQAWTDLLHWLEHRTPEEEAIRSQAISDLFTSWEAEDDETDHQETWEFLKTALDEDRLSDRPLFP